jgi:hypothetical protein
VNKEVKSLEAIYSYLKQQKCTIECYANHTIRADHLLGYAELDLLQILSGPKLHFLTLYSVSKDLA